MRANRTNLLFHQARAITKEDLQRLGTDFLNTPIDEATIATVLERLAMEIDPEVAAAAAVAQRQVLAPCSLLLATLQGPTRVASCSFTTTCWQVWTRTQNDEARRRRQEAAAEAAAVREAAGRRLITELLQLATNDGGHVAVRGIEGLLVTRVGGNLSILEANDLELCGLQDLATDTWYPKMMKFSFKMMDFAFKMMNFGRHNPQADQPAALPRAAVTTPEAGEVAAASPAKPVAYVPLIVIALYIHAGD